MRKILVILLLLTNYCYSQGDCPPQYSCIGGNLTAVVDVVDELNPINQGCLAVNEGTTSYWLQICAQTAGTIQFTIAPAGSNNDFDWSVWNGINCPPNTSPIRCSYAVSSPGPGGDNTGVNSVNNAPETDNSEGVFGNQWTQDIIAGVGNCYTICINNYGTGSNNFTLTFGGTAVLNCTPLPVEYLSFNCLTEEKDIKLTWTTASETNNSHFNIMRSNNAVYYTKIGTISGNGTTSVPHEYQFKDYFPNLGNNYYKLLQVDYNGFEKQSNIIECSFYNENLYNILYYNLLGQEVDMNFCSSGIYIKVLYNESKIKTEKLIIIK